MTPGEAQQLEAELLALAQAEMVARLNALGASFSSDLKKEVSVPVPTPYKRATPGAPPRKDTGRGRGSIAWKVDPSQLELRIGNYLGPFNYMQYHEYHNHPWWFPVWRRNYRKYCNILGVQDIPAVVTPT